MLMRTISLAACLILGGVLTASGQMTEQTIQQKLQEEGYTQVRDISFGAEATTAKAVKDGKEWRLVLDSNGKVIGRE